MQRKIKIKNIKNVLKMIASVYSRRCGSYRMYLEGDSPHQAVMIVCELKRFSHISNRHNMYTLCNLAMFFTNNMQYFLLFLIHVQIQCDLTITSFTCGNVCSLNCRDLFLKYKIDQTCLACVCVCVLEILVLKFFFGLRDYFERFLC